MMDLKQSSDVAIQLRESFADVTVLGARHPITVHAREHTRMARRPVSCSHSSVRIARNVTAGLRHERDGRRYLTLVTSRHPAHRFLHVTTCTRCDAVLDYKEGA